ncbi:sulfatase family protein [Arthrobacter russicus]|uniref:Arylsulfatase A-like enzyme n=1 Tax=Arthrobacter russicus TaxID=172040 RepID=A0ABU1J9V0_9MICC|nr:sulfatase-like hydrolase/transferase [Arthrobacter russicus]MDR6268651.1 arylsulfatase A-like enzyme [Arthrobacter russicus]
MPGTRKPNVLLIISDDHGYGDRSATGLCPDVSTPALDRLAADGVDYSDAYVTAPICSPSRSSLIVGVHQKRWGGHWFNDSAMAPETFQTLPERLVEDGYRTGYFGKVHYGHEEPGDRACPEQHGFQEVYYGLAAGQMGRLNYLRHSAQAVADYGPEASWRMAVQPMFEGAGGAVQESELEGFLTEELGRRTREFIAGDGQPEAQPFFAMLAFNAVHNFCWQLPDDELAARGLPALADWSETAGSYLDWYEEAINPNLANGRAYYLAQLELMDRQIGLILDQLDEAGIAEDTLVFYLTDNGGSTCNYGDNAPLRGTKYTLYEGGIRVPFLARWPGGGFSGGRTESGTVSSLDIAPTVLRAAGVPGSGVLDGVDLAEPLPPGREFHWDCGWTWAVRCGDWKLTWTDPDSEAAKMVRLIEHADPGSGYRLHNLAEDLGEQHDVQASRPDIVEDLQRRRRDWVASLEWPDQQVERRD